MHRPSPSSSGAVLGYSPPRRRPPSQASPAPLAGPPARTAESPACSAAAGQRKPAQPARRLPAASRVKVEHKEQRAHVTTKTIGVKAEHDEEDCVELCTAEEQTIVTVAPAPKPVVPAQATTRTKEEDVVEPVTAGTIALPYELTEWAGFLAHAVGWPPIFEEVELAFSRLCSPLGGADIEHNRNMCRFCNALRNIQQEEMEAPVSKKQPQGEGEVVPPSAESASPGGRGQAPVTPLPKPKGRHALPPKLVCFPSFSLKALATNNNPQKPQKKRARWCGAVRRGAV